MTPELALIGVGYAAVALTLLVALADRLAG
jgi:hypothetical protein